MLISLPIVPYHIYMPLHRSLLVRQNKRKLPSCASQGMEGDLARIKHFFAEMKMFAWHPKLDDDVDKHYFKDLEAGDLLTKEVFAEQRRTCGSESLMKPVLP